MKGFWKALILTAAAGTLAACGGGGASNGASTTGQLNLSITDAPVDGASKVLVTIDGISVKATNGSEQTINMNASGISNNKITVNLLNLQGTSMPLFANEVASGDYQWVRFHLASASICFVTSTENCYDLQMPTQDELKTSGSFHVNSNGVANISVDWDLRKSIVQIGNSGNTYRLKPVLHVRDNSDVGTISGAIISPLDTSCAVTDTRAVYVYSGTVTTPGDMGGNGTQPIASVYVKNDNSFSIGMLEPGTYTLAFTCDAGVDDPAADDSANMTFPASVQATVTAGQTTSSVYIPGT